MVVAVFPVVLALVLWVLALRTTDLGRINDYGLLPALPWTFYAALAALLVGFALALGNAHPREWVLGLHVSILVAIVHGTPALAYGTLRYAWAWKHVGIVDYIQRHGSVDPSIQFLTAYHNWPGFFALGALYTQLAGFTSALSIASWAPVFFNLLFAAALVVALGALTSNRRRVWLAVWLFVCASWVGQDYFSPQAFCYFLFLAAVAICLAWFRARRDHPQADRRERVSMLAIFLLLTVAIAASHQLTPMMLILATGGLVLARQLWVRSLPVLVAAVSVGWVALFAVGFLRGNLYWIVDSLGTITTNAGSTLLNLGHASAGQQWIARIDRALTLGVWALGLLGLARLARRGRADLSTVVLALAPFAMLGATSYGGEILFRVYFFSLPFTALLATGLFYPGPGAAERRSATAGGAVAAVLLAGLLVAYYGKERQNHFTPAEVHAARVLYTSATPGSLLVGVVNDYPWAFSHYEDYRYLSLADLPPAMRRIAIAHPGGAIAAIARAESVPCAYVVLTASQGATVDMTGVMPRGSVDAIERRLLASPGYRLLYRTPAAVVIGTAVGNPVAACGLAR